MITAGKNSTIIAGAVALYVKDGDLVADVTYGKGAFWTETDCSKFTLLKFDIAPTDHSVKCADFGDLNLDSKSVDVVVLDPPYIHNPGNHVSDGLYNNKATTKGLYHDDILRLYTRGIIEAHRVLKPLGLLWVKCKDQVEGGWNRFSHVEIHNIAQGVGFQAKDLCILLTAPPNPNRWTGEQHHLRKNHSFLWIFEAVRRKERILFNSDP